MAPNPKIKKINIEILIDVYQKFPLDICHTGYTEVRPVWQIWNMATTLMESTFN